MRSIGAQCIHYLKIQLSDLIVSYLLFNRHGDEMVPPLTNPSLLHEVPKQERVLVFPFPKNDAWRLLSQIELPTS
jgi:hypothetical protein